MFRLKMIKAATINSRRLVAGCEIEVDTQTALSMIKAGTARLLDAVRPVTSWCSSQTR